MSDSENEDVCDISTDYDSDDEVTADRNTGQTQSLAASAAAQQQVNLNNAASVPIFMLCTSSEKGCLQQCALSMNVLIPGTMLSSGPSNCTTTYMQKLSCE